MQFEQKVKIIKGFKLVDLGICAVAFLTSPKNNGVSFLS